MDIRSQKTKQNQQQAAKHPNTTNTNTNTHGLVQKPFPQIAMLLKSQKQNNKYLNLRNNIIDDKELQIPSPPIPIEQASPKNTI